MKAFKTCLIVKLQMSGRRETMKLIVKKVINS